MQTASLVSQPQQQSQQHLSQPQRLSPRPSTDTSAPASPVLNLDHYKYLRSLLPPIPHFIESLCFTDLNNWECTIYVALLSESDCMKWLTDFQEATKTDWRVDKSLAVSQCSVGGKLQRLQWGMVYRCMNSSRSKDCSAKLEMKILAQSEQEKNSQPKGKQYPCMVNINYYHNHAPGASTQGTVSHDQSFKVQDIPSHLKEQFEGYFLETIPSSNGSDLESSLLSPANASSGVVLLPDQFNGGAQVFSLEDVSRKLDEFVELMRSMLKKSGTGCAAVKQFTDRFEQIKSSADQLETALCAFGSDVPAMATPAAITTPAAMATPTALATSAAPTDQLILNGHIDGQSAVTSVPDTVQLAPATAEWSLIPAAETPDDTTGLSELELLKRKKKKKKRSSSPPQVLPGHIDPITGKRRKRSRCGTCPGCINRDRTQDCRECRNCLDQKRYGGPGRLKKACVKRSCVIMQQPASATVKTPEPADTPPNNNNTISTISLPLHPIPVASVATSVAQIKIDPSVATTVIAGSQHLVSTEGGSTEAVQVAPQAVLSFTQGTQQFSQTFQVQQPHIQFTYQPTYTTTSDGTTVTTENPTFVQTILGSPDQIQTISTSPGTIQSISANQLETLAAEAARHHGIS